MDGSDGVVAGMALVSGMVRALPAVLAVGLVGCAPSEDNFPDAAGKATCRRIAKCEASRYENQWESDFQACSEDQAERIEGLLDLIDVFVECTYVGQEAGEYLRTVASASCGSEGNGEINDELDDVYDCG